MSREVQFDADKKCDKCRNLGAFDFMGDYICAECYTPNAIPPESVVE